MTRLTALLSAAALVATAIPAAAASVSLRDPAITQAANERVNRSNASNWPALPANHGGRTYSRIIMDEFGDRQRNFESGRR